MIMVTRFYLNIRVVRPLGKSAYSCYFYFSTKTFFYVVGTQQNRLNELIQQLSDNMHNCMLMFCISVTKISQYIGNIHARVRDQGSEFQWFHKVKLGSVHENYTYTSISFHKKLGLS